MDVLNSEIQAHKHVENVQASAASKLKSLGLSRFADDFLLFQLPYGTASENLDINMTLYSVILKRELDVMETSGDITRFSRETYVGKSGSTNLIRTRVGDALWSTFEYGGKTGEVFEAKIDPSKQGGVSWLELLRRDVQTAGLESKFMGQVMSQVALLSDFEVSQAVLKVSKKGILPTSTEFVMSFTEPNPTQFPAIGFSLMQEGGRVYASTGPDIKNAFMVFNSQSGTHKKLGEYFRKLSINSGFKGSDNIKTGKHFTSSWVRLG